MESKFIWMNDELVPFEKATLHFLTPALHYGAAVFEGIRAYNTAKGPAVFRLREHSERLLQSAEVFGFRNLPWTWEQVGMAIKDTVRANGFKDCYIRPLLYLDGGGWNLNLDGGKPGLAIAVWEWTNYLGEEALAKGIRANISSFTRHHPNVSMTKAKISGNYANSVLAKTESVRLGFEEAIMLDPQGYIAECTGENLFIVRGGKIITPSTAPVLEGITRHSVYTIAKDLGYDVLEQLVSRDQLYVADEVFVCGTAAECIGLSEIDFRVIGNGKTGPVTRQIQNTYHDAIRGRLPQYESWCDYVDEYQPMTLHLDIDATVA
ncbi:MAG: branched-chain amino acid transaminase [Anaerolineales bacterium]|nr:branched-chain amino acid transaminase [Anaerolineales bacterium]